MRLDCQMQALRKTKLDLAPFLRQTAADFLNSGLAEGFSLALDLPDQPLPSLEADEFLLRRALNNLLINCVRHNPPGAVIRLGARQTGKACLLWVENTTPDAPAPPLYQEEDGGPAHGTGLKLVAQIAAAHGGQAAFFQGKPSSASCACPCAPLNGMAPPFHEKNHAGSGLFSRTGVVFLALIYLSSVPKFPPTPGPPGQSAPPSGPEAHGPVPFPGRGCRLSRAGRARRNSC